MTDLTHEQLHEQVRRANELDGRTPRGIRLGAAQIEAVQRYHRQQAGMDDVGPVTEFMGIPVLPSRAADRLVLEYDGDAEDADAPTTVAVPEAPLPVEQEQPAQ
jgi:hypothetical protein